VQILCSTSLFYTFVFRTSRRRFDDFPEPNSQAGIYVYDMYIRTRSRTRAGHTRVQAGNMLYALSSKYEYLGTYSGR
jgi:hypothetical protein